jgi:hypothetical protein
MLPMVLANKKSTCGVGPGKVPGTTGGMQVLQKNDYINSQLGKLKNRPPWL